MGLLGLQFFCFNSENNFSSLYFLISFAVNMWMKNVNSLETREITHTTNRLILQSNVVSLKLIWVVSMFE